jgi:MoxR-like ATPase
MPARKAPTILSVTDNGDVTLRPDGSDRTFTYNLHKSHFDKNTWIKLGSFLGAAWTDTPMKMDLRDIKAAVIVAFHSRNGSPVPATATVEPSHTDPTIEGALASVREALNLALQHGGISEDKVRTLIATALGSVKSDVQNLSVSFAALDATLEDLRTQVRSSSPTQLVINGVATVPTKGVVHRQYGKVAAAMSLRDNVYLVGPAGTGKTTIPSQVADAMGLRFAALSCGVTDAKFDYAGYRDGNGNYNGTLFRDFWENGGVLLLDEFDNSSPELPIVLNSALANGYFTFPDGKTVAKHADTVIVTAANTYGSGASAQYVGRSPIDAATLDRFTFIEIDLDEAVEDAMVAAIACDATLAKEWVRVVRKARANVAKHGLRVMVTPRATVGGLKLLATGAFTMEDAFKSRVAKGLDAQQYDKVAEGVTFA